MTQEKMWNGFPCHEYEWEGHRAIVVRPGAEKRNGQLAVKTEYWDAFPGAAEIALLEKGFMLCYLQNDTRFGLDEDLDRKMRFIRSVQEQYRLQERCVLIGMSCGGLIAIQFAAKYPGLVGCMYLDAPVLNYMSCPCGFGVGDSMWEEMGEEILSALGLNSLSELLAYRKMPLDRLPKLVESRIPVVMVAGDSDRTVPYVENGIYLEHAYREAGISLEVYIKPGGDHHPHGLADNGPVVRFIEEALSGSVF